MRKCVNMGCRRDKRSSEACSCMFVLAFEVHLRIICPTVDWNTAREEKQPQLLQLHFAAQC